MLDPKYGRIVTTSEAIIYDLLMEQRRTNELLNELLARISAQEKTEVTTPVEEQAQPVRRRKRREG